MSTESATTDTTLDRLPPQSLDSEQAVLGALLVSGDGITRVVDLIEPEYFYRKAHQVIYAAMLDLFDNNEPIDIVTVSQYLKDEGKLDGVGGRQYITDLSLAIATTANLEYYARIVQEKALLRHLIKAGTEIVSQCYDEPDADAAIDRAEHLIFNLAQKRSMQQLVHIKHIVETSFQKIEERYENRDSLSGVPSGFYDLDALTSGFQPSDLIIVAARPSMGKTALCLNIAQHVSVEHKIPVAIFSLEMSKEQLVSRMLCSEASIDANRLRTGHLHTNDWTHLAMAMGRLGEAPIFIDDSALLNVLEIRAKARRLKAEMKGLGLIIVDYIQLLQGRKQTDNRVQEVSEISRSLKTLAREISVPVIALSQLSRAVEARQNKRPMLSDLRESGCLTGDTLVYLPDLGVYKPIIELIGQSGFNVMALDTESWKLEPCPVTKAFSTGRKPVFKLTTKLNRTIRATSNHKFLTVSGWKRLDELTPGSRIALPRRIPASATPSMTLDELALLGYLIGDGCTLARHAIQFTTADRDLAEHVAELAGRIFGDKVIPRINKERRWYQVYLSSASRLTHGKRNPIAAWLDSLGIFNLRSYEKRIPESVFSQPSNSIAHFLRHLWATDGCIYSPLQSRNSRLYYATSSQQLARDIQSLLLRLGINAVARAVSQGSKGRTQFHIDICGKPDIQCFLQEVGIQGERKQPAFRRVGDNISQIVANTNRDVLPLELWRAVVEPARIAAGLTTRQMQSAMGSAYCGTSLYKTNLSRERAARVAGVVVSQELTRLSVSDVYWDEILSVEPAGEEEVFDLTVDRLHNFVANDIVVHNSIEQDSDLVMFIYRDEYYNPESERRGEAEIIIAKQRNGPTGTVDLLYQASITRFLNKVHNQYSSP
jgi:replicative DNA helicase